MISLSNFNNIDLETDIAVITLDDNLLHTYCAKISWERDNSTSTGTAKLTIPYSTDIEKYWSTYSGTVIIHANLNPFQKINKILSEKNKITKKKEKNKIRIQNNEYNYSFIGKIHRFKQVGKTFVVYLEDLGWKFLQKVPDDFRKTYIAGQTLDNAFQAICEFMNVEFAYSIKDLSELNFSNDGYSIEKDGKIIEDTPTIFEEFRNQNKEDEELKSEDEHMGEALITSPDLEFPELIQNKNQTFNTSSSINTTNTQLPENLTENKYHKEYEEEFHEKIKDLFKGNTLYDSNVSDPILNYDWITVQPTVTSTSTDSASSSSPTNGEDSNSESNNSFNGAQPTASSSLQKRDLNGWHNGQYYINGLIYLSDSYINSLSPSEAWAKYIRGQGIYRDGTLNRLRARGYWQSIR